MTSTILPDAAERPADPPTAAEIRALALEFEAAWAFECALSGATDEEHDAAQARTEQIAERVPLCRRRMFRS